LAVIIAANGFCLAKNISFFPTKRYHDYTDRLLDFSVSDDDRTQPQIEVIRAVI
jgi:hypothetical protein